MKLKTSLLAFLCLFFQAYAQPGNTYKALKTGDKMPDMQISGLLNYEAGGKPADQIRMSQFNDQLLILDFWGTYCTPCLHLLPKYDTLQNQFAGKIQFLLVTREKSKTVQAFFKKNALRLPSITDDYLLSALFPHNSIPFEVWIRNGAVIAMTYGEDVSAAAIQKALDGHTDSIAQRKDDLSLDPLQPLLANGNGKGEVVFQSVITPYLPGVSSPEGFQRTPEKIIAVALNHSPLALYQQAFIRKDPMFDLANRCSVELPDSLKRIIDQGGGPGFHEWIKQYGYSYQLTLPPGFTGDISEVMATDLNRYFGARYHIRAALEKREQDCLVLSRIPGTAAIESKGGEPLFSETAKGLTLRNLGISSLDMDIAQRFRKLLTPYINETGYEKPIDLQLRCDLSDLAALQKELRRSGLDLNVKKRPVDILVIRPAQTIQ
ncbi:TlpA disulfide reductase family protein [Mucilaginibacter sp. L3T2-6]|uniref:TlpA family protein disulfide reductase n=1 Tax=Mucilaginibacter sp. L3T2-6 TaxID=3062491 RepID=UPI002674BA8B|nr:TlpA disulfide reductase family protein [Mucilaginibacter sp. L3T2-6]MDO3641257.1 TlpA disulfide reductase family protein [Mucilaginibacter sp. L3T2-6]MDV6213983.1 TlpA disulfide reductase family protein [Mucilaginibacter sp. L3T2-6]